MTKLRRFPPFLAALLASGVAGAAAVGDTLPPLQLKDAHGKDVTLSDSVRRIYASAGREGDRWLKEALKERGQATLDAQRAVVIADISAAPGFVKGMIRSSLKDRGYATWLDQAGSTRSLLPYREDRIAIVELDARRITAIRYAADVASLRRELASTAPAQAAPAQP